jgi:ribonuclease-3 family protein
VTSQEDESSNSLKADSGLSWAEIRLRQLNAVAESNLKIQQVSPASLAYLGDAVYELYIRTYYLLPPKRICDYHHQVVAQVRAESQANHLRSLEPHLTAPELEILRRGRNAVTGSPRRLEPKTYQQATSLETLMGYLYLTNPQRLTQLLAHLDLDP